MTKAIGIKVKKAEGEHDLGASKFFGTPTLPSGMAEAFKDTEIFFCQIRCRDIAEAGLIAENDERLPHSGYLYVFLDTAEYPYRARVLHCVEEPAIAMDDFNAEVACAEHLTDDWLMEFSPAEETAEGIRLLGLPTDWPYAEEPVSYTHLTLPTIYSV